MNFKKLTAFFLTIVMVVSLCPFSMATAQGADDLLIGEPFQESEGFELSDESTEESSDVYYFDEPNQELSDENLNDSEQEPQDEDLDDPEQALQDDDYSFDELAHDAQQKNPVAISAFASYVGGSGSMIENSYLQFYVGKDMSDSVNNGRFTVGNTGGNPNYASDNDKILLFGHPNPWSSYTTVRINNVDYIFNSNNTTYDAASLKAVSTMTVDGVLITQTLQIVNNETTGYKDTVKVSYSALNQSSSAKNIGIRIMMDTMLGDNDGAPFKVPSLGNVTYEQELTGNSIPQSWQAFDSLTNASVFAVGTLYKSGDVRPDKVQFVAWPGVYDSSNKWNYTINAATTVTGDSAVAIYWNPRSVAVGTTTEVNTYYGVGYASSGGGSNVGEANVPANGFAVMVMEEDHTPVAGVTVTASNNSSATTDQNGIAIFGNLPTGSGTIRTANISVSKSGYQSATFVREVSKGALTGVTMYRDDGTPHISSVSATLQGKTVDLLSGYMYFKSDAEKTPQTSNNTTKLHFSIDASASGSISKYQLIQSGQIVYESNTPSFDLTVITGKTTNDFGNNLRIERLKSGQVVYLQIVDSSGRVSQRKTLGLKVSDPDVYSSLDTKGKLNIGKDLKINVPSNIPIIGDTEIELGWNSLPFEFEISDSGKVRFAINKPASTSWESMESEYREATTIARSNAAKAFGGTPQSFGAGMIDVKANIMGYGEGSLDANGNLTINVGVVMTISQSGRYTQTFFLGWVPVYVAVGEKVSLTGTAQITVLRRDGAMSVSGALGEINPKLTLNVDGGVGADKILSIGASGRATLSWLNRWTDNYNKVSLTGEMYLVATAWLFKAEKKLASGTWTIYDSYSRSASPMMVALNQDFYDSSSFSLMDRDYLNYVAPRTFALDSSNASTVQASVFPNAMPKLVQVGSNAYVFWLQDIPTRSSENRTALVYSVSSDMQSWSAPAQVITEDGSSTADFNFDVAVDGMNINIIWSKAKEQFDSSVTIDEMAAGLEAYYAKLDTTSSTVSNVTKLSDNAFADMLPAISSDASIVAWITNNIDGGNGVLGQGNTYTINYATPTSLGSVSTFATTTGAVVTDIAAGKISGNTYIAYVEDTDGDLDTSEDKEIWLVSATDGSKSQLTDNSVIDSNPIFGNLNGNSTLFWYSDGDVFYTNDLSTINSVFGENRPSNLTDSFYLVTDPSNNAKLIWEAVSDNSDEYNIFTAFYASEFDGSDWSLAYKLSDTSSELTSQPNGYIANGKTYLTFVETCNISDSPVSSVKVAGVEPESDVALVSAYYDFDEVALNSALPLTIIAENTGSVPVNSIKMYVDNVLIDTISNAELGLGMLKEYAVNGFTVPSDLNSLTDFTVRIEVDGENNTADNTFVMQIGYTDLAISSTRLLSNGDDFANIIISNISGIDSTSTLRIAADEPDGAILYENNIDSISALDSQSLLINLNSLTSGAPIDTFYFSVVADKDELYTTNNTDLICLGMGIEQTYNLTVQASAGGTINGVTGGQYYAGDIISISAVTDVGYEFTGWNSSNGGRFAAANSKDTTFTMPENDVIVTANFKTTSSSGDNTGSSSGSGGSSSQTQTIPAANGAVSVSYTQSGGTVTLSLTDSNVKDIIDKSTDKVVFDLTKVTNATSVIIPKNALASFADAGLDAEIKLPGSTATLSKNAAASITTQATGNNINIEIKQVSTSTLNSAQKSAVKTGDIILDISILSNSQKITTFDGSISFTIPYSGELPVGVWYLNDSGELEKIDVAYSAATKTVTFSLTHLSLYIVGHDIESGSQAWINPFSDVRESDWFYEYVKAVNIRGLFSGTTSTTFSPSTSTTRAMFVRVLANMDEPDMTDYQASRFTDVPDGTWYTSAVEWAADNGIVTGVGNGKFDPNADITREQMATMLNNYINYKGISLPANNTPTAFADEDKISTWAFDAVKAIQAAGIVSGKPGNLYGPKDTATRAEVAAIFARLIEIIAP